MKDLARIVSSVILLGTLVGLTGVLVQEPRPEEQYGRITPVHAKHGSYLQYIPLTIAPTPEIVVLAHGTPDKGKSAIDMAEIYIDHWTDFAEETGAIVLSVAFDQYNYGSIEGGDFGGYRSLMGRTIGADAFVEEIVDYYRAAFNIDDERFYLYGHSAGGQFVARYCVTHPERGKGAVISASGRYPFPIQSVSWPFGMGRLQTPFQWDENEPELMLDIQPDPNGWVEAAGLPIVVVVGLNDTEPQYADPGQQGTTRLRNGSAWVRAMNTYAEENGGEGNIRFSAVPGRGHSGIEIMPFCQEELKAMLFNSPS